MGYALLWIENLATALIVAALLVAGMARVRTFGRLLLTAVLNGKVSLWNLVQVTASTVNQANLDVGTQQILNVEWTDDSRLLMFFDASGPIYLWGIGA